MSRKLKIEFDDPGAGWMGLTILADDGAVTLRMSYTPFDPLDELVGALHGAHNL